MKVGAHWNTFLDRTVCGRERYLYAIRNGMQGSVRSYYILELINFLLKGSSKRFMIDRQV